MKKNRKTSLLEKRIQELTSQLAERDAQLAEIYMSKDWKLSQLFRKIRIRLMPPDSLLDRIGRTLLSIMMEINFWKNLLLLQKKIAIHKRPSNVQRDVNRLRKTDGSPQDKKELNLIQRKKQKPKIAYLIPGTAISGGVAVVCEHTNRLLLRGYDVSIISEDNSERIAWFPNQYVPVLPLRQSVEQRYDTIVATSWTTAYAAQHFQTDRKFYFVQSDESRFHSSGGLKSKLARKTYDMNFEFITMAKWLQNWLKEGFNKTSIYIPNGLNEQIVFPDVPIKSKEDKVRVLLEGPINIPFKGMEDAFMAVEGLDCEVWCVSSFGVPKAGWKCDKFFEKVPFGKMRHVYSSCDILLKMSRVESFSYPPLEMMACGGTAVVGQVPGIEEYIVNGYNALVVEQGDIRGAQMALKKLIENETLRHKLIVNGKKTAQKFSWEPSIDILEDTFLHQ